MTTEQLLERVISKLDDAVGTDGKRRWSPEEIVDESMAQAQRDLCELCRGLLKSKSLINEVLATATITLSGTDGTINSVTVNDVVITNTAVPFNASLTQTATDLAQSINDKTSSPNYTASSVGAVVTISAVAGTGSNPNDFEVEADTTGLTAVTTDMSGGMALCAIYLLEDKHTYDIHPRILEIVRVKPASITYPLTKRDTAWLDQSWTDWENADSGTPKYWNVDGDTNMIRFIAPPDAGDTVTLSVYRLPLVDLSYVALSASPEIPEPYHTDIIPRTLQYCFEKNDEETFKPNLAKEYEAKFMRRVNQINITLERTLGVSRTTGTRLAYR